MPKKSTKRINKKDKVRQLIRAFIARNNAVREEKGYPPYWRVHSTYSRIRGVSLFRALEAYGLTNEYRKMIDSGEIVISPVRGGYLVGLSSDRPNQTAKAKDNKIPTFDELIK